MTKQLNKKGTSLVELIAVIVIMGIIAGIAVPVTIAVINRQKKNAAAKSAEAVVSTIKQLTNELVAQASTNIVITLTYATEGNTPSAVSVKVDGTEKATATLYAPSEFTVENLKATGSIQSTYTVSGATYAFVTPDAGTQLAVSGYYITVDATGSASAGAQVSA